MYVLTEEPKRQEETKGLSRAFGFGIGLLKKKVFNLGITVLSGGTSKLLTITGFLGGKFVSFLGGLFAGREQAETADSLKKASLVIAVLLILPIFLVLSLSFFDMGILKPTAIVEEYQKTPTTAPNITGATGVPTPIPTTSTTYPRLDSSETVPQGFPIESSCVTQPPGGRYSHQNLNAVDIGQIAASNAWIVRATHSGRVIVANSFGRYGLTVLLESHDRRYITYYSHLRLGSIRVRVGDLVERETQLGVVDNTGFSSRDHLHYEIRSARDSANHWGGKSGIFGEIGTILNFLPDCRLWSCQFYCI